MHTPANIALRIAGANGASGFDRLLRELWRVSPIRQDNDIFITDADATLLGARRNVVYTQGPLLLAAKKRHKLAGRMIGWIPGQGKNFFEQHGQRIPISYNEDSSLNRIYACKQRLGTCPNEDVRTVIRDELLPFMNDMLVQNVCGVAVDAEYQGKIYSFSKMGLLSREYGSSELKSLVFEKQALSGIMPSPLNLLWYVSVLTRIAPVAFTLAVARGDCAWHFMRSGCFLFSPSVRCEGLFHQFSEEMSPITEGNNILPPRSMAALTSIDPLKLLYLAVRVINCLYYFINDLRNFAEKDTRIVDFSKHVQTIGAFDLLFADLSGLNYSTVSYHRIGWAMNALDKLANLLKHLGNVSQSEGRAFKSLLNSERCSICRDIIEEEVATIDQDLAKRLSEMILEMYQTIHLHYRKQSHASLEETDILNIIRWQRNLRHGTFLNEGDFMRLFGQSKGTVAPQLIALPFLLVLALALDPHRFLQLA